MESATRAIIRIILITLLLLSFIPPVFVCWKIKRYDLQDRLVQWYYRIVAIVVGLNIKVEGPRSDERPLLIVSNHCSYIDVYVLGCLFPVRFTPKKEVQSWPVFGFLASVSGSIYIERKSSKAGEQKKELQRMLQYPICISIFPEGSTNNGVSLLPFKSSLLSIAEEKLPDGRYLPVQPVAIAYTRVNNLPIGLRWRSLYAWFGDMDFVPHLWQLLKQGVVTIHVDCLPTITAKDFASRKEMAAYCHDAIAERLEKMLRQYS